MTLRGDNGRKRSVGRRLAVAIGVIAAALLIPAIASAHVERASYWPDPGTDTAGGQPAGGEVPGIRSLFTALDASQPGDTRVVCQQVPAARRADQNVSHAEVDRLTAELARIQGTIKKLKAKKRQNKHKRKAKRKLKRKIRKKKRKALLTQQQLTQAQQVYQQALATETAARQKADSDFQAALAGNPSMQELDADIADARANGVSLRPSQPSEPFSSQEATQLRNFNAQLLAQCRYDSIQRAVTDSGNNDRIVIMPGTYTEPASRAVPSFNGDAANASNPCHNLVETNDHGNTGAVSYKYQADCPNDQNLIAVIGRQSGASPPPLPLEDRHGIPDEGPCMRCNLQIEGSGPSPDDVIVEGGDASIGDHSPGGTDTRPYTKDVGIRVDRADGFVLNNVKVRHFNEHGVYAIETDGFNLNRLKTPYDAEYGVLTFVADHSLIHNCDAWGAGDSGLYPGASADTQDGESVPANKRYGNEIRDCDSHHNAGGYSGTDGNAVHIHDNNFYDNTLGFTTDVFTAPGHPGFPQDSDLVEDNNFYSNNFNTFLTPCDPGVMPGPPGPSQDCSDVIPTVPVPVGTGMWIAGGNHNIIRNNHFWDNWRRGTMLFAVPDQLICGPDSGLRPEDLAGCNPTTVPPSTSYDNEYYGNTMGRTPNAGSTLPEGITPAAQDPNGDDFWWDEFVDNTGNCWHDNVGPDGTAGSLSSTPVQSPLPGGINEPHTLPDVCGDLTDVGGGAASGQETELLDCFANISGLPNACDWFDTPAEP